jgi:hypothetical protein
MEWCGTRMAITSKDQIAKSIASDSSEIILRVRLSSNGGISKLSQVLMNSPQAKWFMIINGKYKAWFYPSKGLNELFHWAGKLPSIAQHKRGHAAPEAKL